MKLKLFLIFLFGNKYYLNVCNDRVSDFIVSTPFKTRREARQHRLSLEGNRSVRFIRTVTMRTWKPLELAAQDQPGING